MPSNLVSWLSVATNISIIIVGIKLVRHMASIEFKVEMMWEVFKQRFIEEKHKSDHVQLR